MSRRRLLVAVAVAMATTGCGSGDIDKAQQARLDEIQQATQTFESVDEALKAGYRPVSECIESPNGDGALGQEYVNLDLLPAGQVDLLRPVLLFYDPNRTPPKLLGVGYQTPAEKDHQRPPDTALGHMDGPIPGIVKGQPTHFELHAWVHTKNPEGPLATWNEDIECP